MLYDVKTPQEYIDGLDADWRRDTLLKLRNLMLERAPELIEGINYKMLGYRIDDDYILQLNAQMKYVSLYVGTAKKVDPDGTLLAGLDVGKGCIRFKKTTPVVEDKIGAFIRKTVDMYLAGEDIDC